jgi:dTMP kinase
MPGRFIVFEGIDTEVLTYQAEELSAWLRSEVGGRLMVSVTREPTDGPFGAQLRLVLERRLKVDEFTKAALFMTDRMDHLHRENGVLEDLEKGYYVVCIRYLLSTYAYQSREVQIAAERLFGAVPKSLDAFEWLRNINQLCLWPDLVIFIDTPVESCIDRIREREGADIAAQKDLWKKYEEERAAYLNAIERCRTWGNDVLVIDGNQPRTTIQRLCRDSVIQLGLER